MPPLLRRRVNHVMTKSRTMYRQTITSGMIFITSYAILTRGAFQALADFYTGVDDHRALALLESKDGVDVHLRYLVKIGAEL